MFFRISRKVFHSIVTQATLSEFDLLTYVAELERVINNRPITAIPSSTDNWAVLTPSAILIGSLGPTDESSEKLLKAETYKSAWKTQFLTERFWHQ